MSRQRSSTFSGEKRTIFDVTETAIYKEVYKRNLQSYGQLLLSKGGSPKKTGQLKSTTLSDNRTPLPIDLLQSKPNNVFIYSSLQDLTLPQEESSKDKLTHERIPSSSTESGYSTTNSSIDSVDNANECQSTMKRNFRSRLCSQLSISESPSSSTRPTIRQRSNTIDSCNFTKCPVDMSSALQRRRTQSDTRHRNRLEKLRLLDEDLLRAKDIITRFKKPIALPVIVHDTLTGMD